MHYVSDLFTDSWWISYIWHANRVTLDPNGWVEGAADVHEKLSANSSAQCIGHCAQHMPLVHTKYQTFVPKWWILYALLLNIWLNISQIHPHLYQTSHPIVRGPVWQPQNYCLAHQSMWKWISSSLGSCAIKSDAQIIIFFEKNLSDQIGGCTN